ncbi:hypothetical protein ROHU_022694 [Labeo rohita]|uniref:Uncharacterized protein n=1 Tax=Labeo rohita TaxID=84645 RepID=A0A498N495_LABRO|nr:hypothetical protein ROHU_022694 [Labeo rohita]
MRQVWRRVRGSGETETPLTNRPTIHCGFNVQTRSRRSAGAAQRSEQRAVGVIHEENMPYPDPRARRRSAASGARIQSFADDNFMRCSFETRRRSSPDIECGAGRRLKCELNYRYLISARLPATRPARPIRTAVSPEIFCRRPTHTENI